MSVKLKANDVLAIQYNLSKLIIINSESLQNYIKAIRLSTIFFFEKSWGSQISSSHINNLYTH